MRIKYQILVWSLFFFCILAWCTTKKISISNGGLCTWWVINSAPRSEEQQIEDIISNRQESHGQQESGKRFCAIKILREKKISKIDRWVVVYQDCQNVLVKSGDLRGTSWFVGCNRFEVQKVNNQRIVADYDDRLIPSPTNKQWLLDLEKIIPKTLYKQCNDVGNYHFWNKYSTSWVIDKAAKYYWIQLPNYTLDPCKKDTDCKTWYICALHNSRDNIWPNTCVKACNGYKDCWIAHTCRNQFAKWTKKAVVSICIPDILNYDIEITPNEIL